MVNWDSRGRVPRSTSIKTTQTSSPRITQAPAINSVRAQLVLWDGFDRSSRRVGRVALVADRRLVWHSLMEDRGQPEVADHVRQQGCGEDDIFQSESARVVRQEPRAHQ